MRKTYKIRRVRAFGGPGTADVRRGCTVLGVSDPYDPPDPVAAAVRLCTQLNALTWPPDEGRAGVRPSVEVTAAEITGPDAAHHVIDREGLLGLDPLNASELATALAASTVFESTGWQLVLPQPGRLGALAGPPDLSAAAVEAGAAVVAAEAGFAFVPSIVGRGVQWQVLRAARPRPAATWYEAERALSEAVLEVGQALTSLDVSGGDRPRVRSLTLPRRYEPRRQASLDKAFGLYEACRVALDDDGTAISSYEMITRRQHLQQLIGPAAELVCAVCSTPPGH